MAVVIRRSAERGHGDHGWLDSRHTFSFAEYRDPAHMGFRALRVLNEDRVAPGGGFPPHPHRDMEIFSYVLEGELQHEDSMGNGRVLAPGEVQLMSAGRGVTHSEFNASPDLPLHFLQVWIRPAEHGLEPGYTEWRPPAGAEARAVVAAITPDGRDGSAVIHQDASVHVVRLPAGGSAAYELAPGRGAWVQVARGDLTLSGAALATGDGAACEDPGDLAMTSASGAEALIIDLA